MTTNIENTIKELTERRDKLTICIETLKSLDAHPVPVVSAPQAEPPAKRTYKPRQPKPAKAPQTQAEAAVSVDQKLNSPATFSGAMKRAMRESTVNLTAQGVLEIIQTRWPSFAEGRDKTSIEANLRYWSANGHCEKLGIGPLAVYKVTNAEHFKETVE